MDSINDITGKIIGAAIAVHRELGPGLLESPYHTCLAAQLVRIGLFVERHVTLPLEYMGERMPKGYILDLLVERRVVVEIKSVARLEPVHFAQVLTYLKLTGCEVGLLINFNVAILRSGIKRVVHQYRE